MLIDRVLFHSHLHPGEQLLYVVHQHWWVIRASMTKIGFFGWLLPMIFLFMFTKGTVFFIVWLLCGIVSFLYTLVNWYFDAVLVTSLGLVDLDWRGFFDKTSRRISFEGVEGVEYTKTGFFATLLNFGHLMIETEGHPLGLPCTADPQAAEHAILHAKEHAEREQGMESEEALREILSEIVANHLRNKKEERLSDLL